jgi:hypothetical protein
MARRHRDGLRISAGEIASLHEPGRDFWTGDHWGRRPDKSDVGYSKLSALTSEGGPFFIILTIGNYCDTIEAKRHQIGT